MKRLAAAVLGIIAVAGLITVAATVAEDPAPADAQGCYVSYIYGSPTRTIARDAGRSYCDVQARLARMRDNYTKVWYYSGWRLYEAKVSSWNHNTWAGSCGRNQARVRTRSPNTGNTLWTSKWYCYSP